MALLWEISPKSLLKTQVLKKSSRLNVLFYNQTGGVGLHLVQGLTLVVVQAKNLTLNETFLDLIIESFLLSELSKSLVPSLLVSKLAL